MMRIEELNKEFIREMFDKVEGIRLYEGFKYRDTSFLPDFAFKVGEVNYIVEVKTKFSPSLTSRILNAMNEVVLQEKNTIGIIVIFDKVSDKYKKLIEDNYKIRIFDVSNILYMVYNDENLIKDLNTIVDFSLDKIIPQAPSLDFNIKMPKKIRTKINYQNKFKKINPGIEQAKQYERLMQDVVKEIFNDELTLFSVQNRTEDGINIFDMICKIKNNVDDDFFSTIEGFFKSKYILFEFKNYEKVIKQGQICTTEKYLYETALRKVAIIITRKGIDKNGLNLSKGILRETGKLIITLDDNDVIQMINLNRNGDKASKVLTNKLDEILTTLEK